MSDEYPISGGKMVVGPDGVTKRVTFRDRPQTPDEKQAFAQYEELSPLEILRRLRIAEWNAAVREQERDQWKEGAQQLELELARANRKLASYPPDGYEVPKAVADLAADAEDHGWQSLLQWSDNDGTVSLHVQIGRKADEGSRGPHWLYKLTYFSRDCGPGKIKRRGTGLAQTPDNPQWHGAPSVRQIREAIYENPAPGTVTVFKGPISKAEFNAIPNARALRFSHDWMGLRYTEWIEDMPGWGWSLVSDYGKPDRPCHVSRADSRLMAADHLTAFLAPTRAYGGDNLTVDEWEIGPWPVRST